MHIVLYCLFGAFMSRDIVINTDLGKEICDNYLN